MIQVDRLVLSGHDMFPVAEEFLQAGQKVVFTVSGNSMWPLIRHNQDSVLLTALDRPIRPGDIVLLNVSTPLNHYVLHRIYRVRGDILVTLGDGCLTPDPPVPRNCILGMVEAVYRGRRTIHCDALPNRFFAWLWRILLPIRQPLLKCLRYAAKARRRRS